MRISPTEVEKSCNNGCGWEYLWGEKARQDKAKQIYMICLTASSLSF